MPRFRLARNSSMFRAYHDALGEMRRFAIWTAALLTLAGITEGIGIAALFPLLSSHLNASSGGQSEWFGLSGDALTLASVAALVGLGLVATLLRYLGDKRSYLLSVTVDRSLRGRMAGALMKMQWSSYLSITVGEALNAVIAVGAQVGMGCQALVQGVSYVAIAVGFVAIAFLVDPFLTLAVLVFGGFTAALYRRASGRSRELSKLLSGQAGALTDSAADLFTNAKFYRSTGLLGRALSVFEARSSQFAGYSARVQSFIPSTRLGFDGGALVFMGGMLVITLVILGNSLASAFVFLALFYRLAPKLQQAQQSIFQARTQMPWWQRWKDQYDVAVAAAEHQVGTRRFAVPPAIEFRSVGLTYPSRSIPALRDVTCRIAPGECLAVVGESGAGKTTMLDLVTGLLPSSEGTIQLDGIDLADVDLATWRSRIGLVIQDSPVFHATVLENIAWGDDAPDESRALRAAKMANLTDVIDALPDGLHTIAGQKGGFLSGGQRQRLALARALYSDPWLLILDEATSALDSASERVIQDALASLRGSCSMLVVAHRLKTVEIADRILVLAGGRVVEHGSWEELRERDGVFRKMLMAQMAVA